MTEQTKSSDGSLPRPILVCGDICLDVVGVPMPPQRTLSEPKENWRLTGELRTHYLPGGAMLLAEFIRAPFIGAALAEADREIKIKELQDDAAEKLRKDKVAVAKTTAEQQVRGPRPIPPFELNSHSRDSLSTDAFLEIAERLKRNEIVHSLLELKKYRATGKKDEKADTLRVERNHGFSGPIKDKPCLTFEYGAATAAPEIIVLDDTGNGFRCENINNPWPEDIKSPAVGKPGPLIIYKLHRPLPAKTVGPNCPAAAEDLWEVVKRNHQHNRLLIVSIDDLREIGLPISRGLSWERTALDVVWHLLNTPQLEELKACPRLIVRLGESGAVYWRHRSAAINVHGKPQWNKVPFEAWLIYEPQEIEGAFAARYDHIGSMVGAGSAFTAALVHRLAAESSDLTPLLIEVGEKLDLEACVVDGIRAGLTASRRLLAIGYGTSDHIPTYPGAALFAPANGKDSRFPCHRIPIIPEALQPDRSYWRLLDDIFANHDEELREALAQIATGSKPSNKERLLADATDAEIPGKSLPVRAACYLSQAPIAVFAKALRTYDRREMEHYRALYSLLHDYVRLSEAKRPLSVAIFGPPGSGKSFGVQKVAEAIGENNLPRAITELNFNLSQYQSPDELANAFHLIRDRVLEGKIPLVFFDEFDTALERRKLAWLRHFLAPMQDGNFLDRGEVHPIGQSIFIFAGGTCDTFQQFAAHPGIADDEFKAMKGPDFLSRLRGALDIPSLNFLIAREPRVELNKQTSTEEYVIKSGTFDPYAPVETFPCRAAILLRRAGVLAFQLGKKAPTLKDGDEVLNVRPEVLRALLYLPEFTHGNRSFEALLDMSQLVDAQQFTPSMLPPAVNTTLHANPEHLEQLVGTGFPFSTEDREILARSIHKVYQDEEPKNADPRALLDWNDINFPNEFRESNREQADDIAIKLRAVGLWYRKVPHGASPPNVDAGKALIEACLVELARIEHDRWLAQKRAQGWAAGKDNGKGSKIPTLMLHNCIFQWDELTCKQQQLDYSAIRAIPEHLANINCEIIKT